MTPNADYELLLLGSLLHYGADLAKPVLSLVESECFTDSTARQMYGVIAWAVKEGLPLGEIELYEYAKELGAKLEMDKVCVLANVAQADLDAHALHLRDLANRRRLRMAASELAAETGLTADEIVDKYSARLSQFRSADLRGSRTMAEIVKALLSEEAAAPSRVILPILEEALEPGTLTVIGGATGMGKTTYALQAAVRTAERGAVVRFASLEMAGPELAQRIPAMSPTGDSLTRLHVHDGMGSKLAELVATCKRWVLQGADLLVIDHLQLVTAGKERFSSRRELIGEAALRSKQLARETNVPVLLPCQLRRLENGRGNKRPDMSDLKESGDIENHADRVVLLWRPEYYGLKDQEPEVILAKNRHGRVGYRRAQWDDDKGAWA